jgi:uncharacterized protein (TIGR02145 family)
LKTHLFLIITSGVLKNSLMNSHLVYLSMLLFLPTLLLSQDIGQESRTGKDFALFFAVNTYDHPNYRDLDNPVANARDIAAELMKKYGFATEVIANPTLEEIEKKLKSYQSSYQNGERPTDGQLLLFFSGHGVLENRNGYFLPKDTDPNRVYRTGFAYDYWREFINTINCQHILVVIDACFSGTFDPDWNMRAGETDGRWKRPGEVNSVERLLQDHQQYTTRLFITSGTEVKTPDRSRFAKQLLEGLRGKSPLHADGIFTLNELWTYLENARPSPYRGGFGNDDASSNFLFIGEPFEIDPMAYNLLNNNQYELNLEDNLLTDKRDHQPYRITRIENMIWMAENMNFDIGSNWCYGEKEYRCNVYGQLYTWEAANRVCQGLGAGWRLPSREEWQALIDQFASPEQAYTQLKEDGQHGLNLLLGGTRLSDGSYKFLDELGNYWSASSKDAQYAVYFVLSSNNRKIYDFYAEKTEGQSCRCVLEID